MENLALTIKRKIALTKMGLTHSDQSLPLIGILHEEGADTVLDAVRFGILSAGGAAITATIPTLYDCELSREAKNIQLPHREITADEVESLIAAYNLSGAVLIATTQTTAAGMIMGAVRKNLPFVFLPAFLSSYSPFELEKMSAGVDGGRLGISELEMYAKDVTIGRPNELEGLNSLCLFAEAADLSPYGCLQKKSMSEQIELCRQAGRDAAKRAIGLRCPRRELSIERVKNATAATLACGGTMDALLHILAIANENLLDFNIDDIEKQDVPLLFPLKPFGEHSFDDFYAAGGFSFIYGRLSGETKLIKTDRLPTQFVSGDKAAERIKSGDKYMSAGITVIKGNIGSAITRTSDLKPIKQSVRVYVGESHLMGAILNKTVKSGDIIVLKGCGRANGMPLINIEPALCAMDLSDITVITEGRCVECGKATYVCHLDADETFEIISEGDIIEIDFKKGKINLGIPSKEINSRLKKYKKEPPASSFLSRYAFLATSPQEGCTLKNKF